MYFSKDKFTDIIKISILICTNITFHTYCHRAGISEKKGNELLDVMHGIMDRHESFLPMGHTWKAIKTAVRRKSRGVFQVDEYTYLLPEKFFGQTNSAGKQWLPVKAYGLDIRHVLAKALLDTDPVSFVTKPKEQTYGLRPDYLDAMPDYFKEAVLEAGDEAWKSLEIDDDSEFLLSDFSTGSYFRALCADADKYPVVRGKKPIHICLSVFSDKSLATASCSEQPVVFSILNCVGKEYKMLFLGYAPITLPYSDEVRLTR